MNKYFFKSIFFTIVLVALIGCGPKTTVKAETTNQEEVQQNKELTAKEIQQVKINQMYAQGAHKKQDSKKVLEYVKKVTDMDPEFKHANNVLIYWRAQAYDALGKTDEAIADYEKYQELKPEGHKGSALKLEYLYTSLNKYDKVIELNKKLLKKDPENATYLKKIGTTYYQMLQEETDEAKTKEYALETIDWLNKYLKKEPKDKQIQSLTTSLTKEYLDSSELKAKYQEALKLNPNDYDTMLRLAEIYYEEEDYPKAKEYFDKYHKENPNHVFTIKRLLVINKNNTAKTKELLKKAIKADPTDENYHIRLAKIYKDEKKYVDARNECKKALAKNSRNQRAYKTWASLYTDAVASISSAVEYQDKLVFVIAYGLYKKAGDTRRTHIMKENGQVPSKSDYFMNKSTLFPTRKAYKWINKEWDEVKYIQTYLKTL